MTSDDKYLFLLPIKGPLVQYNLETNFYKYWDEKFLCVRLTRDGKCLFGQDEKNILKQWRISDQTLIRDWGFLHWNFFGNVSIDYFFKISKDDKYLWSRDKDGYLKQWSIGNQFVRDWGQIYDDKKILSNTSTLDGKN